MKSSEIKEIRNKFISVLIAIVLIIIIIAVAFGIPISKAVKNGEEVSFRTFLAVLYPEKYAYSNVEADLYQYFGVSNDIDTAIILQDEKIEELAKYCDGQVYFSIDTIRKLFTRRFYVNEEENVILYSKAKELLTIKIGEESKGYYTTQDINTLGDFTPVDYQIARYEDGTLYMAADFLKGYANFEYRYDAVTENL